MLFLTLGDYEGNNKKPSKMRTRRMSWIHPDVNKILNSAKNLYAYVHINVNEKQSLQHKSHRGSIVFSGYLFYYAYINKRSYPLKDWNMNIYQYLIGSPFSPGLSRTSIYALCIIPVPNDTTIWLMVYLLKGFSGLISWLKGTIVTRFRWLQKG